MKKKIWILNHYATNQYIDENGRHHSLAKYLIRQGYEVKIFCANTIHNSENSIDLRGKKYVENIGADHVPYCFVSARQYKGNGRHRIMNMIDFYRNIKCVCAEKIDNGERPDVIIASSVHPLTILAGIQLDKRKKIPCIAEIRDLWPASIVAYSKRFTDKNLLIRVMYLGEKWIYKKARSVIFLDDGDYDYIIDKGWQKAIPKSKVFYVSNGVDLEIFKDNEFKYVLPDCDLDDQNVFSVVYAGSIRKVNNLGTLLDAAKHISNRKIKILIWGAGDQLEELKQRVQDENIGNVIFKGYVEKKYIASITSRANLNIVHNSSLPILKYGISFNKLFDYMAAEKPMLCDFDCGYNPVVTAGCGVGMKEISPKLIAEEIEKFAEMNLDCYYEYCEKAKFAANKYDYKNLAHLLLGAIEKTTD